MSSRTSTTITVFKLPLEHQALDQNGPLHLVGASLRIVSDLGHDVLLGLHADRNCLDVSDLDLALDLLEDRRSSREISSSISIHFLRIVWPNPPGGSAQGLLVLNQLSSGISVGVEMCVVDDRVTSQVTGGRAVAGARGGRVAVDQGPRLAESTGTLSGHFTIGPVVIITEI